MIQITGHVHTVFSRIFIVGLAVGIYCQAVALPAIAQDNTAPTALKPTSSNASYNYSLCNKFQNKDVITEQFNEEQIVRQPVQLAAYVPPASPGPNLNGDLLFGMINAERQANGLPAFEIEGALCSLAATRATEGYAEIFQSGNIHGGLYARNLPYWITENMKYGSSEQEAFNWWMGSYIHRKAILGSSRYACTACSGNVCVTEFTSYEPK